MTPAATGLSEVHLRLASIVQRPEALVRVLRNRLRIPWKQ